MATVDNKDMIDKLIANDGYFEDDHRVHMIVEYTNAWGNTTWGITWSNEYEGAKERYLIPSEFIQNPKIIWQAN